MVTAKHCMYVARVWCQRHYPWRRWRICTKSPKVGVRNNRTEKLNLLNTANTIKFSFMSVCSEVAPDKTFCQRRVGLKIGVAAFFLSQFGDSRGWRLILCPFVRWQILLSDRHIGSILSPKNWPVGMNCALQCEAGVDFTKCFCHNLFTDFATGPRILCTCCKTRRSQNLLCRRYTAYFL